MVLLTYWVTRDSDPETGVPNDTVDVWYSKPVRHRVGERGAFWLDDDSLITERYATWSLASARVTAGVVPDDDTQCIRIGPLADARLRPGTAA